MFNKILIIAFALVIVTNMAKADTFVTKGLVSYWALDNAHVKGQTVKDAWGSSDGTISGNPQIVAGKNGQALKFDGGSDFVTIGNTEDLNFEDGGYSIEAWIGTQDDGPIITKMNASNERGWYNRVANGKIHNRLQADNGNSGESKSEVSDGEWHHAVVVIDREGGSQKVYIDGKLESEPQIADVVGIVSNERNVVVGAYSDGKENEGKAFFNGTIDEVRLYNRALSDAEVVENFNSKGLAVNPAGKLSFTWGKIKALR